MADGVVMVQAQHVQVCAANKIQQGVQQGITAGDTQVQAHYNNRLLVLQARQAQLDRLAASLTATNGASDPSAQTAQAAADNNRVMVARMNMQVVHAATTAPVVAKDGWALHGHIYDAKRQPLAKLTVFLVDEQKSYVSQYGFSFTDATGYFLLNYAPAAGAPQAPQSATLYLEIFNAAKQPIYLDTAVFTPILGEAQYRDITLTSQSTLGTPPGSTAVPKTAPASSTGKP